MLKTLMPLIQVPKRNPISALIFQFFFSVSDGSNFH